MADITDAATRSRMMSGIRGKNTKPEMVVRKAMHRLGLRYRLHVRDLAGAPDLVFPKYKTVIFVNGCFWHQHRCPLFRMPATRKEFWEKKLNGNRARDEHNMRRLIEEGWRVGVVWECSLRNAVKKDDLNFFDELAHWVRFHETTHYNF